MQQGLSDWFVSRQVTLTAIILPQFTALTFKLVMMQTLLVTQCVYTLYIHSWPIDSFLKHCDNLVDISHQGQHTMHVFSIFQDPAMQRLAH